MKEMITPATPQRVIRVFVSSTFRDMQTERDELVKRIFPQLRKLCDERGVTWSEVDLRWGITEEEAERGEVLPICLAEIQRCRPYFIGLLGERYGWVPEAIPAELLVQEPWLNEHLAESVTEMEILHGALNNPAMADRALFYFRDPAFVESRPPDERADFVEAPTPEEIERFGRRAAERLAQERARKLAALKQRIRSSSLPVRENYPTPEAFGELVLRDLTEIIEQLYPPGQAPDPLDREALDQDAFAQSRARVYIGRQGYYDRLDRHALGDGPPLVITGESGSGKSALLSNWALRYRQAHANQLLLMHFIGATPQSADWAAMLRRIMGELKRSFGIRQAIPDQPDELRLAFAEFLNLAAASGGALIIFDALNQLEDRDGGPDLLWLPPVIPPGVRLIFSTLPGRALDELTRRRYPTLRVEPLEDGERRELIQTYLAQSAKHLSAARIERIASAKQSANPLYLRALLGELLVFGVHEQLDERINHYLVAKTPDSLYQKILERYEQDYERERPGLVRDAMSALWAARRGLSESEALELLGKPQHPLPRAYWSPLYLAAEQSLLSRAGLIGFSHDFLRQAVRQRYLRTKRQQADAHRKVADYFAAQPLGARKVAELPWQLAEAAAWRRLYDLLADLEFFAQAWMANSFDVQAYWSRIEGASALKMIDAYRPVLNQGDSFEDWMVLVDLYLMHNRAGYDEPARAFYAMFQARIAQNSESSGLRVPPGLAGDAMVARGDPDAALRLYREQERICRENGNQLTLQLMLGDQASILITKGSYDEALRLAVEQEQICRELSNQPDLLRGLGFQSVIKQDLLSSLAFQSFIFRARGDFTRAMQLIQEHERICRELDDKERLQESFFLQAEIARARGDLNEALRLHQEQERICRELGFRKILAACISHQANICRMLGDSQAAARLEAEQEQIANTLNNMGKTDVLSRRATALYNQGRLDEAMRLLKECETLSRETDDRRGLAASFGNQAMVVYAQGENAKALRLYQQSERIWRELGDKAGVQSSLGNQVPVLHAMGRLDESMLLCKEQERLCRELGNRLSLQQSLGNQAVLLRAFDKPGEAARLYEEQERICRELDYKPGLALALINQASLLANEMQRPREGLPLADAAYRLAMSENLFLLVEQIEPVREYVRERIKELAASSLYVSTPHPNARADRAAQLNVAYQRELARWKALPWWKRARTKKPEPPRGI